VRAADDPLAVEPAIQLPRERHRPAEARDPGGPVGVVVRAPAQGAGSMPGRQRHRLVVEEQDREMSRLPLRQSPVLVPQRADDPQRTAMEAHDVGAFVQDAAVAEPRAAKRDRDDVAERRHPIAHRRESRHGSRP